MNFEISQTDRQTPAPSSNNELNDMALKITPTLLAAEEVVELMSIHILHNQRDATHTMFFIIISALHVLGGISAHHQELIKLRATAYVDVLEPTHPHQG